MLHVLVGCATVGLTYLIGCRLQVRGAWIAGVGVAVDPILLRQSQLVMTETLATFLAVLAWWLWLVGSSEVDDSNRDEATADQAAMLCGGWQRSGLV